MIFRKKNNRKIDKYSPITNLQQILICNNNRNELRFEVQHTTTKKKLISVIWQQKVEVYP